MANQDRRKPRAHRARPTPRPSRRQAGPRRAEHVALAAQASCGPRKRPRKGRDRRNRNTRRFTLLLFIALALMVIPLEIHAHTHPAPPPGAIYWTQNAPLAHQDAQRSSAIDIALTADPIGLLWQDTTGVPFLAGPVMDEHRVYTVDRDGNVSARSIATGTPVWSQTLDENVAATPALGYGWLYVATLDGNLYALEARTGAIMQETKLSGPARADTLVAEGRVFQGTDAGALHVLDSRTLSTHWRFDTSTISYHNGTVDQEDESLTAPIRAPPAYYDERVIITAWNGLAYALSVQGNEHDNPKTLHWSRSVGEAVQGAPTIDHHNNHVIVPTNDGRLQALNPATGNPVWTSESASFIAGIAVDGKQIIARTSDSDLFSLNATTGAKQWSRLDPSGHLASPVLTRDAIIQAAGNGTLALLSRTTGQPLAHPETRDGTAQWAFGGAIHAAPAVTQNAIAVVDHSGTLTLLGPPPDFQSDLEALSISTIDIPLGPELGLELGVYNHGPDPSPDIHVRIERDGTLHMERNLGSLDAEQELRWEFRFASTPGDHELTVTFRPVGATDPEPERATHTQTLTLTDLETPPPDEPDDEPPAAPPQQASFTDGLTQGLAWALIPGLIGGAAGGIVLARRASQARARQAGAAAAASAAA